MASYGRLGATGSRRDDRIMTPRPSPSWGQFALGLKFIIEQPDSSRPIFKLLA